MCYTLYEGFEQVSGRFVPLISYSAKHFNVTIKNTYILLDVLLCSIAEYMYFYELCRILTSHRVSQNTNNE